MSSKWIPIKRRLPKYGERVVVWCGSPIDNTWVIPVTNREVIARRVFTDEDGEHWQLDQHSHVGKHGHIMWWRPLLGQPSDRAHNIEEMIDHG